MPPLNPDVPPLNPDVCSLNPDVPSPNPKANKNTMGPKWGVMIQGLYDDRHSMRLFEL